MAERGTGRVTDGVTPRPHVGVNKLRLSTVVEFGLRLAAVGLLIVAVVLAGVAVFVVLVFGLGAYFPVRYQILVLLAGRAMWHRAMPTMAPD